MEAEAGAFLQPAPIPVWVIICYRGGGGYVPAIRLLDTEHQADWPIA